MLSFFATKLRSVSSIEVSTRVVKFPPEKEVSYAGYANKESMYPGINFLPEYKHFYPDTKSPILEQKFLPRHQSFYSGTKLDSR
jgi:hypothetical protein